jgi:hypothetical protein
MAARKQKSEYEILKGKFETQLAIAEEFASRVHDYYIRSTECTDPAERHALLMQGDALKKDMNMRRMEVNLTYFAMYHKRYYV